MEKLLKRLPKKYHERVRDFYADSGLMTDVDENGREFQYKYIILFAEGWAWDEFDSLPCRSITEAIEFIKDSRPFDTGRGKGCY
jgi:hypothetical protein